MTALDNAQHELFAQQLARGKDKKAAYVAAGFKSNSGNASTLASRADIQQRVRELAGIAAEAVDVTVQSLLREAEQARTAAMENGQIGAAIAAIREKGILSGKRVERSEHGTPGEFDWLENATENELRAFVEDGVVPAGEGGDAAASGSGTGRSRSELN